MSDSRWQVQEAKQRFSEVIRAAESGDVQIVTRHGEDVAAIIDIDEYRRLRGEEISLHDYLRNGPGLDDLDLTWAREDSLHRDLDLPE